MGAILRCVRSGVLWGDGLPNLDVGLARSNLEDMFETGEVSVPWNRGCGWGMTSIVESATCRMRFSTA
jgi:hypothetical protein